jgi:hypothetical protein
MSASSWAPRSPIFLFPLPVPASESSSFSPTSVTSHSTLVVPSALMPIPRRVLCVRPSALPDIISSNQDKSPEVPYLSVLAVSLLVDATDLSGFMSPASSPSVKALVSVSCGSRPRSSSARMSSSSRLPTVTCRYSDSRGGSSLQYVRCVPQKPQKIRLMCGAWCGVKVRRMVECVSSG